MCRLPLYPFFIYFVSCVFVFSLLNHPGEEPFNNASLMTLISLNFKCVRHAQLTMVSVAKDTALSILVLLLIRLVVILEDGT